ncbi:hypothetical protein [Dechloromonas sp. H13]|uniref:hypothetical protein n=1 Tax=Dechloromonas sp. H13 TaxID=2570193 RepID=UPI0018853431|nr:hypothetical protein [Dechloromonas sp. H13]
MNDDLFESISDAPGFAHILKLPHSVMKHRVITHKSPCIVRKDPERQGWITIFQAAAGTADYFGHVA